MNFKEPKVNEKIIWERKTSILPCTVGIFPECVLALAACTCGISLFFLYLNAKAEILGLFFPWHFVLPLQSKKKLHIWSNYNQTPAFLPLPLQRKGQYYLASHRDHAYTFRSIYQLLLSTEYTRTKLSKLRPVQVSMCHFQSYCTWNFNRW